MVEALIRRLVHVLEHILVEVSGTFNLGHSFSERGFHNRLGDLGGDFANTLKGRVDTSLKIEFGSAERRTQEKGCNEESKK